MKCTIQDKSSFSNIPNPLYFSQDLKLYILETYFIWGEKKKTKQSFFSIFSYQLLYFNNPNIYICNNIHRRHMQYKCFWWLLHCNSGVILLSDFTKENCLTTISIQQAFNNSHCCKCCLICVCPLWRSYQNYKAAAERKSEFLHEIKKINTHIMRSITWTKFNKEISAWLRTTILSKGKE